MSTDDPRRFQLLRPQPAHVFAQLGNDIIVFALTDHTYARATRSDQVHVASDPGTGLSSTFTGVGHLLVATQGGERNVQMHKVTGMRMRSGASGYVSVNSLDTALQSMSQPTSAAHQVKRDAFPPREITFDSASGLCADARVFTTQDNHLLIGVPLLPDAREYGMQAATSGGWGQRWRLYDSGPSLWQD
jgi:hypothetical protein